MTAELPQHPWLPAQAASRTYELAAPAHAAETGPGAAAGLWGSGGLAGGRAASMTSAAAGNHTGPGPADTYTWQPAAPRLRVYLPAAPRPDNLSHARPRSGSDGGAGVLAGAGVGAGAGAGILHSPQRIPGGASPSRRPASASVSHPPAAGRSRPTSAASASFTAAAGVGSAGGAGTGWSPKWRPPSVSVGTGGLGLGLGPGGGALGSPSAAAPGSPSVLASPAAQHAREAAAAAGGGQWHPPEPHAPASAPAQSRASSRGGGGGAAAPFLVVRALHPSPHAPAPQPHARAAAHRPCSASAQSRVPVQSPQHAPHLTDARCHPLAAAGLNTEVAGGSPGGTVSATALSHGRRRPQSAAPHPSASGPGSARGGPVPGLSFASAGGADTGHAAGGFGGSGGPRESECEEVQWGGEEGEAEPSFCSPGPAPWLCSLPPSAEASRAVLTPRSAAGIAAAEEAAAAAAAVAAAEAELAAAGGLSFGCGGAFDPAGGGGGAWREGAGEQPPPPAADEPSEWYDDHGEADINGRRLSSVYGSHWASAAQAAAAAGGSGGGGGRSVTAPQVSWSQGGGGRQPSGGWGLSFGAPPSAAALAEVAAAAAAEQEAAAAMAAAAAAARSRRPASAVFPRRASGGGAASAAAAGGSFLAPRGRAPAVSFTADCRQSVAVPMRPSSGHATSDGSGTAGRPRSASFLAPRPHSASSRPASPSLAYPHPSPNAPPGSPPRSPARSFLGPSSPTHSSSVAGRPASPSSTHTHANAHSRRPGSGPSVSSPSAAALAQGPPPGAAIAAAAAALAASPTAAFEIVPDGGLASALGRATGGFSAAGVGLGAVGGSAGRVGRAVAGIVAGGNPGTFSLPLDERVNLVLMDSGARDPPPPAPAPVDPALQEATRLLQGRHELQEAMAVAEGAFGCAQPSAWMHQMLYEERVAAVRAAASAYGYGPAHAHTHALQSAFPAATPRTPRTPRSGSGTPRSGGGWGDPAPLSAAAAAALLPRHTSVEGAHLRGQAYLASRDACRALVAGSKPAAALPLRAAALGAADMGGWVRPGSAAAREADIAAARAGRREAR